MAMRATGIGVGLALLLVTGCDDAENSSSPDTAQTSETASDTRQVDTEPADTASPVDTTPATEPDTAGSDDAVDADEVAVVPDVPTWDFAAAAPWFGCPDSAPPDGAVEVPGLPRTWHRFTGENTREVDAVVEFPEGQWAQVGMRVELVCPLGGCDAWDRVGSLQLVLDPEAPRDAQRTVELVRHVTPYGRGMCQFVDVTPLAGLLTGPQTLRSVIDTWVGPGHSDGDGWLLTTEFVFVPGADAAPREVISVTGRQRVAMGSATPTVDDQLAPFAFTLPDGFERVEAHLISTGHGFGNTGNCAEFCPLRHDLRVNDEIFSVDPWRDDCASNPVSPQAGTWEYERNGWCPGAVAVGERIDVTAAVNAGANELELDILTATGEVYVNSLTNGDASELVSLQLYVW